MRILMIANRLKPLLFVSFCFCPISATLAGDPIQFEWVQQVGYSVPRSVRDSYGPSIAMDDFGNIFLSGITGNSSSNINEDFIIKYDSSGNLLWTSEFENSAETIGSSIALDSSGNIFLTGGIQAISEGSTSIEYDAYLRKIDPLGNILWTQQFGSAATDITTSIEVDLYGNAYVTGFTLGDLQGNNEGSEDSFVSKIDGSGNLLWTNQYGTAYPDSGYDIGVDDHGNVYVTGITGGTSNGGTQSRQSLLNKYDSQGNLIWTKEFGTDRHDISKSVAIDGQGNIIVAGISYAGSEGFYLYDTDFYVNKYDSYGNQIWEKRIEPVMNNFFAAHIISTELVVDGSDNIYASGISQGAFDGTNDDLTHTFVSKLDASGDISWTKRLGVLGYSLESNNPGEIYLAGRAYDLFDDFSFNEEFFLLKLSDLPTPGDFNRDGIVDAADYTTWRDGLGTIYDIADYNDWVANYGNSVAISETSTESVPEPTALLILLSISGFLASQQKR